MRKHASFCLKLTLFAFFETIQFAVLEDASERLMIFGNLVDI